MGVGVGSSSDWEVIPWERGGGGGGGCYSVHVGKSLALLVCVSDCLLEVGRANILTKAIMRYLLPLVDHRYNT